MSARTKEILRIALPAVAGYLGIMVYDMVDMFWIARLGREAVAGAASAGFTLWTVEAFMESTTIGCAALIAQSIGARNEAEGRETFREAFHLSLAIAVVLSAAGLLGGRALLGWMGLSGNPLEHGNDYLRVSAYGFPLYHVVLLLKSVFNAHGDTKTETMIMGGALTVNAVLDPFLIFGWGPFPELGVGGAAWATNTCFLFGSTVRILVLRKRGWIPPLGDFLKTSSRRFRPLLSIGVPTALVHAVWTMSYPLLTKVITLFGVAPLAGMSIAHRFEGFAYFTSIGFSVAMASLVGRKIGAGDSEEARAIAAQGRKIITAVLVLPSIAFVFVPEFFVALLSPDALTTSHGANYLQAVGLTTIFLGWELSYEGAFNGMGKTRPYMLFSIPLTLGRFPAAYLAVVVLGFGVSAVWWTISISTLLKGVGMSYLFGRIARQA